ncbi:MAG: ABC transporter substrate-binding protein [Akkermansia sp.]|nr:ABC transporter substrate-binding protein [Akkermansia sp.]
MICALFRISAFLCCILMAACSQDEGDTETLRIGHFPNVTHVQALVARSMARNGDGWFEKYLPGIKIEWYSFNAGPSAMEAIFGKTIDASYVGPSPAINAYAISRGREVRLLSGAVDGGAALLVHDGASMKSGRDFSGKTVATPQLGNTQDISARAWLKRSGLHITREGGGDTHVTPTSNSMQLPLFQRGDLDAVWTVEPWVSRLEREAGARVLVEDTAVVTTVLVAREAWLREHPERAARLVKAHEDLTQWILDHPREAQKMVADELSLLMRSPMDLSLVETSWKRLKPTTNLNMKGMKQFVRDAQSAGLLGRVPPLDGMKARLPSPSSQIPSQP